MTTKLETKASRWKRRLYGNVKYDGRIRWWAGYDHRAQGYGQHGDEFACIVRLVEEDAGLVMLCRTYARDGHRTSRVGERLITLPEVELHLPFPTSTEHVLAGAPNTCDILRGRRCYATGGSFTWGDTLWTDEMTAAVGDAALDVHAHFDVFEGLPIWNRLVQALVQWLATYKTNSASLPVRCEHCKGKGLLTRKGAPYDG